MAPLAAALMALLHALNVVDSNDDVITCRDSWVEQLSYDDYAVYSCSKCFVQVFWGEKHLRLSMPPRYPYLLVDLDNDTTYYPDATSPTSTVCAEKLTSSECQRWRQCCQAARHCCLVTQQREQSQRSNNSCPSTWDGVSCWEATPSGYRAKHPCPNYYQLDNVKWTAPQVYRQCSPNHTWHINPITNREYSDYEECFSIAKNILVLRISLYMDFAGNGISIISLIVAILIIVAIRDLRYDLQQRTGLKIHFNLFVSVLCTASCTVAFHSVYHDAFTNSNPVYQRNTIWCRALHIATKYFKSTTYLAMFSEGLFLYRRISQVMQIRVAESFVKYLIITWVVPFITIGVYVIARLTTGQNERCWIDDNGLSRLEFIHIIPNLCSLVCNLVFLISIEYMLCTKMRSDTSDRRVEVFRHAIRATMSLIPVFGIQYLLLIYRPRYWPPYEMIVSGFESTQGTLVAVLYCFTTKEVKTELRRLARGGVDERQLFQMRRQCVASGTTNSLKIAVTVSPPPRSTAPTTEPAARRPTGCSALCGRGFRCRCRSRGRAEKDFCLEPLASRRDSCASRTTQRSYADGAANGAVAPQPKREPRRNGPNGPDCSPETAELLARADGESRSVAGELESAEAMTARPLGPNGSEGERPTDGKTTL